MAEETGPRRGQAVLWFMRLSILGMIALGLAVLYHRHHMSPEQEELLRYAEVQVPALQRVQGPLTDRLAGLLADRRQPAEAVRRTLVDEIVPGLVRLRQLAEAPIGASSTDTVRGLAREHLLVIDQYVEACRTAVRVMDDPKVEPRDGLMRVQRALTEAVERERRWGEHVRETGRALRLVK